MHHLHNLFIFIVLITSVSTASAQVPVTDASAAPASSMPAGSQPIGDKLSATGASAQSGANASQENQTADLKKQIASMREEFTAKLKEQDAKLEKLELNTFEEGTIEETRRLRLSGFFDTTFSKRWLGKKTVARGEIASPQFLLQNFNVILTDPMTDKLSFVGELRLTFLPNGEEPWWLTGMGQAQPRIDSTTIDPYTQESFRLGGIAIERAYLQWTPWDFFGVIVGYYLSPYGIWHLDHGSPTRLTVQHPFQVNIMDPAAYRGNVIVPDAQLGLQLFGRFFPLTNLHIDYALTVSNGRGPADTVIDYDENKALGLRLKADYQSRDFEVALGGYGYYGRYTDKNLGNSTTFIGVEYTTASTYREYVLALDFLIAAYGLTLQAELLHSLVYFDNNRPILIISGGTYPADYSANSMYGLLSYRLPLDKLLGSMTLTPYFGMAEEIPYAKDAMYFTAQWFGLNFKPSPWVTLKTEGSHVVSHFHIGGIKPPTLWSWNTQLAVSF